jgi:hypothetical protein
VIEITFPFERNETIVDKPIADGNEIFKKEVSALLVDGEHELVCFFILYVHHHI